MTFNPMVRSLGLAVFAAFLAPAALAQAISSGWYGGANIGRSMADIDDDRIRSGFAAQGLSTSRIDKRERDTGYKIFGGYQLNRNLALEAGLFDLGQVGYTATTAPDGSLRADIRVKGLNLDLVGMLPITGKLSALARAGVTSVKTRGSFQASGAATVPYGSATTDQRSTQFKVGAGLMYDFTESLAMRLEAERYRIKDTVGNRGHVDMISVGLIYR